MTLKWVRERKTAESLEERERSKWAFALYLIQVYNGSEQNSCTTTGRQTFRVVYTTLKFPDINAKRAWEFTVCLMGVFPFFNSCQSLCSCRPHILYSSQVLSHVHQTPLGARSLTALEAPTCFAWTEGRLARPCVVTIVMFNVHVMYKPEVRHSSFPLSNS